MAQTMPGANAPLNRSSLVQSSIESTYTSLIQQYLSLLCFENATFLAERMVADTLSSNSTYLLAMCYYRLGQTKRAYHVLRNQHRQYWIESSVSASNGTKANDRSHQAGRFLLAKCCIDLGLLEEAEDCLLQNKGKILKNRSYSHRRSDQKVTDSSTKKQLPFDLEDSFQNWILSEPCPIPNGAAGLHLLGVVYRKSHRNKQAAQFFYLSLKLDPMMWTSYEALCEMGCCCDHNNGGNDDYEASMTSSLLNPTEIFGVTPMVLQLETQTNIDDYTKKSTLGSESNATLTNHEEKKNCDHHKVERLINTEPINDEFPYPEVENAMYAMADHLQASDHDILETDTSSHYKSSSKRLEFSTNNPNSVAKKAIDQLDDELASNEEYRTKNSNDFSDMDNQTTPPASTTKQLSFKTPVHPSVKRHYSKKKTRKYAEASTKTLNSDDNNGDFSLKHNGSHEQVQEPYDQPLTANDNNDVIDHDRFLPKNGRNDTSAILFNTPNLTPIQKNTINSVSITQTNITFNETADLSNNHLSYGAFKNPNKIALKGKNVPLSSAMTPRTSLPFANNSFIADITSNGATNFSYASQSRILDPLVLTQARKVVSRLYYEPSPDQESFLVSAFHSNDAKDKDQSSLNIGQPQQHEVQQGSLEGLQQGTFENNAGAIQDTSSSDVRSKESNILMRRKKKSFLQSQKETPKRDENGDGKRQLFQSEKNSTIDSNVTGGVLGSLGDPMTISLKKASAGKGKIKQRQKILSVKDNRTDSNSTKKSGSTKDDNVANNLQTQNVNASSYAIADDASIRQILNLLCTLGAAYKFLHQYDCQASLAMLRTLPTSQYDTGWVQSQVGKAYFEMADYPSAVRALEYMQKIEPHRMKGLEVLSTAFWQLKKEVELCHLAQRVVDFDRNCPECWCVVGNCFSLQKEHETALRFFKRSLQLDPSFTYCYTLSGHEYVSNEDFDKAASSFRDAILSDSRHYNAWYGLGSIYYRQEKFDMAEYHYRRALTINPQSSVLRCHLGMAQHANHKPYEALDTLNGAFDIDPRNVQARYQRANIYMGLDQPREALEELKIVRDVVPRESSVHFAMGKVYKRLGWPDKAMRCFLTALDLDPKDNNLIKAAMERLYDVDIEEDVSAF